MRTLVGAVSESGRFGAAHPDARPSFCKYLPVIDGDALVGYPSQLVGQGKIAQ